jgi:prepilin-type N-terminal cleavage/methylation domain-containing protein
MAQVVKLNNKGFTIIEAIVAMAIFALVLIFMAQGILIAYKINFLNSVKITAKEIASNELENIRNMDKIYDVNGDGNFVIGVDDDGDGEDDYGTDCPEPCTTNPSIPQCKEVVRIRNKDVVFGKSVTVTKISDVYEVVITVCTDYKDWKTNKPIQFQLKTIVSGD